MAVFVWARGALAGQKRRLRARAVAVYSVEGGASTVDRSWFHAEVQGRDFWETYMPAFHACVVKAKATHVMCSYNFVNGVPSCGNKGLLTDVLRTQWNFSGFVSRGPLSH